MSGGNIGKAMAGQVGVKPFLKENEQLKMAGKAVQLSNRMIVSITKHVLKQIISRGIEY
jgi:hypothetical protein